MVLLVIVTPKHVGFGYYVGHMPHKFINQKQKKLEENQKHQSKPKKTKKPKKTMKPKKTKKPKKTNPLEETLGHNISPKTLFFLVSLVFLVFFEVFFCFFLSPVADETFRV